MVISRLHDLYYMMQFGFYCREIIVIQPVRTPHESLSNKGITSFLSEFKLQEDIKTKLYFCKSYVTTNVLV